jgi:uncharacterized protein YkwD
MRLVPRILLAALTASALWTSAAAASPGEPTLLRELNAARADHGLAPVRTDARLTRAATRHSRDMVAHHYFAHESRGGARFSSRIQATGFMRRPGRWWVGESLAWGRGPDAAPEAIVRAWLQSPSHRRVVLSARYRRVGIGIARGTPAGVAAPGVTYTADFGS